MVCSETSRLFSVTIWCMGCFVAITVSIVLIIWNKKRRKKHFRKYILGIYSSDKSEGERLGRCCILPFTRSILPLCWWDIISFQRTTCMESFEGVVLRHVFLNRCFFAVIFGCSQCKMSCKIEFLQFLTTKALWYLNSAFKKNYLTWSVVK